MGYFIVEIASDTELDIGLVLQLPAILDLKAAGPLTAELLARRGADLSVGAAEVQRLGGQCLQVLLAAAASWREDQLVLRFEAPSQEFLSALALFGVTPDLLFDEEEAIA